MIALRRSLVPAVVLMMAALSTTNGQGPLQKQINFNINVPYALTMGDYVLPAGNYVLRQVSENDLDLFALYEGKHMMHSPVAMIRTIRVEYGHARWPEKTKLFLDIDE